MKKNQLLVIVVGILVIVGIYFVTSTNKPPKANHDPMASMTDLTSDIPEIEPADFDSLLIAAKRKLSPQDNGIISEMESQVIIGDEDQQISILEEIGKFWLNKNRRIAAHYFLRSGKLENSEKKLNFASHLFSEELHHENNPSLRQWMANEAIEGFVQSLEINPDNDTVRIDYALLYIDVLGQTMAGIEQLLLIVQKDENNIPANIILGKMGVESGQLDKAIERGERVLSLDSQNLEAHLFLGEAYKRHNEKDKAIHLFREAKKIMNNPDFSKDVDEYIATFE